MSEQNTIIDDRQSQSLNKTFFSPEDPTRFNLALNQLSTKTINHIYYILLNNQVTGQLFKMADIAQQVSCTPRQVYNILVTFQEQGLLLKEGRGRNGVYIEVLMKGWQLTKILAKKFAFLAYFRDKGLIPYINILNNTPDSAKASSDEDSKVRKACQQEGLTETQSQTVAQHVKEAKKGGLKIKSPFAFAKHVIEKLKLGAITVIKTSYERERDHNLDEKLYETAQEEAVAHLRSRGIPEPTGNDLDEYREYEARLKSVTVHIWRQKRLQSGLAQSQESKKANEPKQSWHDKAYG